MDAPLINHFFEKEHTCSSESETMQLAAEFGKLLRPNSVVCFYGDLGAGKTTFIKGLAVGVGNIPAEEVSSPTFVYLNIYRGNKEIYHFDLYRLQDEEDFLGMGFDEFFYAGGICCLEWSERINSILPDEHIKVKMENIAKNKRIIKIARA